MTCVELIGVEKDHIVVRGLDLLDQTPIVDIKPYLVFQDAHPDAKLGWVAEVGTEKLRNLDEEDEKGRRLRLKRERK
jgi:tRNA (adenine37-N6)-methyltransferase